MIEEMLSQLNAVADIIEHEDFERFVKAGAKLASLYYWELRNLNVPPDHAAQIAANYNPSMGK